VLALFPALLVLVSILGLTGKSTTDKVMDNVQQRETPEEALYRELKEEVGLEPKDVKLVAGTRNWLRYRLPKQYVRKNSHPPCIGQKQRWFLLHFVGSEDRFDLESTGEPEFESWRWVDYWTPVREVIYFKRAVYARALDELARTAFPQDPPELPEWSQEEKYLRSLAQRRQKTADKSG